jgi:hypothetical protein
MKRLLVPLALFFVIAAPVTGYAVSNPVIAGSVTGVELCEQDVCGAAVFVGVFAGRFGNRFAIGLISGAVTHEDLPAPGDTAAITGGVWRLQLLSGRTVSGSIPPTGSITADDDNTFDITAQLDLVTGGLGSVFLEGELNHNTFPPTVTVVLTQ